MDECMALGHRYLEEMATSHLFALLESGTVVNRERIAYMKARCSKAADTDEASLCAAAGCDTKGSGQVISGVVWGP